MDDTYILSLPGFVWFKAKYRADSPRCFHTCYNIGKGQVVSVGGVDFGLGFPSCWQAPDPFQNGIGVFDMRTMAWTGEYNANAPDYDSPQIARDWYAAGYVTLTSPPEVM